MNLSLDELVSCLDVLLESLPRYRAFPKIHQLLINEFDLVLQDLVTEERRYLPVEERVEGRIAKRYLNWINRYERDEEIGFVKDLWWEVRATAQGLYGKKEPLSLQQATNHLLQNTMARYKGLAAIQEELSKVNS